MVINFRKHLISIPNSISEHIDAYLDLVLEYPKQSKDTYVEKHHILPRSLFKDLESTRENLIKLRGRDHLLAHYFLAMALPDDPSMANAFLMMIGRDGIERSKTTRGRGLGDATIDLPDDDLLDQYEKSRIIWSEHSKKYRTVRDRKSGEYRQILKEDLDPTRHAHLTEGSATYRVGDGTYIQLPKDSPLILSDNLKHVNSGMITAIVKATGESVHITSDEFHSNPNKYQGHLKGKVDWIPNEGRTPIRDRDNNFYWIPKNHPDLETNLASGEWRRTFKGKLTVIEVATGRRISVDNTDPRISSGEFVPQSKGMATVVDKDGKTFQVPKNDPRIVSGELVNFNTGKIRVKDREGNERRVYPNDPRIISGEFTTYILNKDRKDKMIVYTPDGKVRRVTPEEYVTTFSNCTLGKRAQGKIKRGVIVLPKL